MQQKTFHADLGPPEGPGGWPVSDVQLSFSHKAVRIDATQGIADLDLAQVDGLVLALDWVAGGKHHIWGSAVMVGPGIAMTASHVLAEMFERGFLAEAGGQLFAVAFHADRVELWRADSFTKVDVGDLSLLTLIRSTAPTSGQPHQRTGFSLAMMAARMPRLGEQVSLIGFKAAEESYEGRVPLRLALVGSVGKVTDLYPQRRDAYGLPNPSIGVAARTLNGMSGGAAFDSTGRLIGVISTGLESEHSFVSLSWPAICVPISPAWWPLASETHTSLYALARAGICGIEYLDDVQSWRTRDGHQMVSISDPSGTIG